MRLFFERGFEAHNDNADPNDADLSKFDFGWTRSDALIRFARLVIAHGATTMFPTSIKFETWMNQGTDPAEFAEQILVRLRRWRERGVDLEFYSVVNEPGFTRSGIWSGAFIRDVIRQAGPRLRAEGFRTKFVVPDDWGPAQAYQRSRIILADPRAREHVGAIAFHLYAGNRYDLGKLRALGRKYGIPLWMTEYSLSAAGFNKRAYQLRGRDPIYWAVLMNDLIVNYDVSAIDYMMGFNGEWGERRFPGAQLIVLEHDGLAYQGFRRTKQYYVMGQFSRFIEPGARRVKTEGAHGDIRVSAFRKGADMTVVGINTGMFPRRVMFAFTSGSLSPSARFRATRGRKTKPSNDAPQAEISSSFGLDRN